MMTVKLPYLINGCWNNTHMYVGLKMCNGQCYVFESYKMIL